MGKEGNQAATFSDYAMPTFQGLRRLIMWHGRSFGTKSITFLTLALFKSQTFIVPILFCNMANGFSGLAIYRDFYFALFDVLNTTFMLGGFVMLDQDVAFNFGRYFTNAIKNMDEAQKQKKALTYDPNVKESAKEVYQKDFFDRSAMLADKGVVMNSDGSTDNFAEYTWYSRDTKMKQFKDNYMINLAWAYVSGGLNYAISIYCLGDIINPEGHVNNYWNAGVCLWCTNVIAHHIMVLIYTRNYTWFIGCFQFFSTFSIFLTVWLNDSSSGSVFYSNQWNGVLDNPLFWMTFVLQVFIVVIPYKILVIYEHVFTHPEF